MHEANMTGFPPVDVKPWDGSPEKTGRLRGSPRHMARYLLEKAGLREIKVDIHNGVDSMPGDERSEEDIVLIPAGNALPREPQQQKDIRIGEAPPTE